MVKLVGLIRQRQDLSVSEFRDHWLETHAKLAAQLSGLRRYAINFEEDIPKFIGQLVRVVVDEHEIACVYLDSQASTMLRSRRQ